MSAYVIMEAFNAPITPPDFTQGHSYQECYDQIALNSNTDDIVAAISLTQNTIKEHTANGLDSPSKITTFTTMISYKIALENRMKQILMKDNPEFVEETQLLKNEILCKKSQTGEDPGVYGNPATPKPNRNATRRRRKSRSRSPLHPLTQNRFEALMASSQSDSDQYELDNIEKQRRRENPTIIKLNATTVEAEIHNTKMDSTEQVSDNITHIQVPEGSNAQTVDNSQSKHVIKENKQDKTILKPIPPHIQLIEEEQNAIRKTLAQEGRNKVANVANNEDAHPLAEFNDTSSSYKQNITRKYNIFIPPIKIWKINRPLVFLRALEKETIKHGPIFAQIIGEGIKIKANTISQYRAIIGQLETGGVEFNTYSFRHDKPLRVVIKGLHHTIPTEEVREALERKGFAVQAVRIIINPKNKKPFNHFNIDLDRTEHNKTIYMLTDLLSLKIAVEPHRLPPTKILQCFRCQRLGHPTSMCAREPNCMRCAKPHHTRDCPKTRDSIATCFLCKGPHSANAKDCPVKVKQLEKRLQESTKTLPNTYTQEQKQLPTFTPTRSDLPSAISYAQMARDNVTNNKNTRNITPFSIRNNQPQITTQPQQNNVVLQNFKHEVITIFQGIAGMIQQAVQAINTFNG